MSVLATGYRRWVQPIGHIGLLVLLGSGSAVYPVLAQQSPASQPSEADRPVLRIGSQGEAVSGVQALLKLLGYYASAVDGVYRANTAAAVSAFQTAVGLPADGVVGAATWDRLLPSAPSTALESPSVSPPASPAEASPTPVDAPIDLPVLRFGMQGPAVVQLQERLRVLGFFDDAIDGIFGAETQAAVEAAQRDYQLEADGVVGPATWAALLSER